MGAYLIDADNQKYVDYISSWGALILGHAHPEVVENVQRAVKDGMTYGAPTELEVELAELRESEMWQAGKTVRSLRPERN